MDLYGLPTSWHDGIEWSLDTKPTARHFQAIFLALGERAFAKNNIYNHNPSIYFESGNLLDWGACAYSAKDIINLDTLISVINGLFERIQVENKTGCFGKGRLEFDLSNVGSSSHRWYDDTNEDAPDSFYNKLIINYQTKRISIYAGLINYKDIVKTMLNKCPLVMKCDKMSIANRKIMAWLIDFKNALNKLHSVFLPCGLGYPVKVDGITNTYYERYSYYKDEDGVSDDGTWVTSRSQNMDRYLYILEGGISNGGDNEYISKDYWADVTVPPLSIQNQLPFSYKASLHISGYCRQYNSFEEDEYYAIEPIGEYIKKIGWNEIGTLNPSEEKQILDASFCYDGNGVRSYWNKYGGRDNCDIGFSLQIDCIRLDFRVEGGFKFI